MASSWNLRKREIVMGAEIDFWMKRREEEEGRGEEPEPEVPDNAITQSPLSDSNYNRCFIVDTRRFIRRKRDYFISD